MCQHINQVVIITIYFINKNFEQFNNNKISCNNNVIYVSTKNQVVIATIYKQKFPSYISKFPFEQPFRIKILKIGRSGDTHEGIWNNFVKKNFKKVKQRRHKIGA